MKIYKVKYYFDGEGEAEIEAKSKKEAEKKWRNGDIIKDKEWGDNYCLKEVK